MHSETYWEEGRLDCIQALRVMGAVAIALFHLSRAGLGNGFRLEASVSLFFAISGFLLMYSTQRPGRKTFLARRLLRLAPLYWLITAATFLAVQLPPFASMGPIGVDELVKSLFFIPYMRGGLSESAAVRPIVGPGWTLYYDVYFAILFALAMRICHRGRGLLCGVFCAVLAAAGGLFQPGSLPYLVLHWDWWLNYMAGVLAFYALRALCQRGVPRWLQGPLARAVLALCAGLLLGLLLTLPQRPGRDALLALGILLAAVLAGHGLTLPKQVNALGQICFAFYLVHYYYIILIGHFVRFAAGGFAALAGAAGVFLLSGLTAKLLHELVEVRLTGALCRRLGL